MMNVNQVTQLFGLGMFVFVAEKALKESGRGDMAFIVNFGGFLVGLYIIMGLISDLTRTTISSFRF